jgi:hypothetical protein
VLHFASSCYRSEGRQVEHLGLAEEDVEMRHTSTVVCALRWSLGVVVSNKSNTSSSKFQVVWESAAKISLR